MTDLIPAADVKVGMMARPPATPADKFWPRPDFARVTSVVTDGGWVKIAFANGTGYQPRESNGTLEVQD